MTDSVSIYVMPTLIIDKAYTGVNTISATRTIATVAETRRIVPSLQTNEFSLSHKSTKTLIHVLTYPLIAIPLSFRPFCINDFVV